MKLLLADDDRDLVQLLRFAFQRDGYTVVTAYDGEAALQVFRMESPDVIVLDLTMPRRSGMEVLREIRRYSRTPVLILSVITDEESVVNALDVGADDYLIKPFRPRELRSRVKALARRRRNWDEQETRQLDALDFGEIYLNPRSREVRVQGNVVRLTPTEFSLLHYLMLNHDMVVPSSRIIDNVWNYDADDTDDDVVRVTIGRLRRKIEPDCSCPTHVVTVPGVGYKFLQKPED